MLPIPCNLIKVSEQERLFCIRPSDGVSDLFEGGFPFFKDLRVPFRDPIREGMRCTAAYIVHVSDEIRQFEFDIEA